MINVTDSIKRAYEESTTQYDKIILDGQEYDINNVQYEDDCYLDGNIFGTAIARTLDFEIENLIDLENKEFKYLTGIKTENGIEWIDLGTFITQEVDPNDTTGITKVTAMDYMLKSNIKYVSRLNYDSDKVTILQVLQEACQQAGMILATTDFANAGFIVDSNQFTEGTLIRQVFQAVAQISGTFAKVRYDDKLYFITPKSIGLKVKDVHKMLVKDLNKLPVSRLAGCEFEMKMNDYSELILKRNTHPINLVSLGMSDIEGENVVKRDEESIADDGENSLVINDNPFAYTEEKRKQLITALFDTVKGFEYTSFEITGQAKPYQETGDEVVVVDKDGTFSYSFLFRFNYKSPNGLESEMSAPSLTKATVNYQNIASSEEQAIKRTELIVDKQNQTITGLITKTDKNTEKLSKHEQTLDSITDTLKSVETTVETIDNKVDTAQSTADTANTNAQKAQSSANTANQNAQNAQKTANDAVTQITTTTQKVTEIEQTVDGITQSVSNVEEKIETVETKADNAQKSANTANTNATNAQNTANSINDNLTTNYYTKTETNSEINQKADEISSTVSKTYSTKTETTQAKQDAINSANASTDEKLEDYSTTEEMNSAITQKADSITSTVNNTLQDYTKKTETESMIEQSAEQIQTVISASIGTTNLVPNSDFSHQNSKGEYDLDGWTKYGNLQTENETSRNKVIVDYDKTWLSIYKETLGTYGIGRVVKPIQPDQDYTLSFKLMNDDIPEGKTRSDTIQATIYVRNSSGGNIQTLTQNFTIANTWNDQNFSYTFHTPNNSAIDNIDLRINGLSLLDDSGGNTVFASSITNIQIELGKIATDWRPSQTDFYETVQQYSKLVQTVDALESTVAYKDDLKETESNIKQTTDSISSTVSKKVGYDEVISSINQSAEQVQINADKISLER